MVTNRSVPKASASTWTWSAGLFCEVWRATTILGDTGHRVNLLFDRQTDVISVKSPYPDGVLRIEVRKAAPLVLRLPSWVTEHDVEIEGAESKPKFERNSLVITEPRVGKPIVTRMPLRTSEIELNHHAYPIRLRLKGDSVVAMENFRMPLTWFDAL